MGGRGSMVRGVVGASLIAIVIVVSVIGIIAAYIAYDYWSKARDSDGDGVPDFKEKDYGTDPNRPNHLLAYALKKLPESEALKFKNVENFDESSKGLVDLYASLPEDKRGSKEVNDLLNQILPDNEIGGLEKNLFDDKFANPSPPSINDLNWTPTRENLDKIYDINVTFVAKDDKTPIAYAELRFIPVEYYYMIQAYGMRPEDYNLVFPNDKERVFVLTPIDGKLDDLEENFSIQIKDIVGGREYKIVALVRDLAGNERIVEMKIPYIRQFENLGKALYDEGIIVMSVYVPFDMSGVPRKDDDPLLGRYDTIDDIVLIKHVDWATGHGINTFILDSQNHWWPEIKNKVFAICEKLLSSNQIKVAWLMGPSGRYFIYGRYGEEIPEWAIDLKISQNNENFLEFVKELMKPKIVDSQNYLKIDGKPVLYIWDEGAFFNQEDTYLAVKKFLIEETGHEAFIIADWLPRIPTLPSDEYVQFLLQKYRGAGLRIADAFTGWIGFHKVGLDTQEYVDKYEYYYDKQLEAWRSFTKEWNKDFIVSLTPGFDNSYSWGGPQIPLPRDGKRFAERLEIAIKYLDSNRPILKIDTWNDWGEWSYIEPSRNEGFSYLEILKPLLINYCACVKDRKPPIIKDLKWEPTRIVNDKVYDINISFSVSDDESLIVSAKLIFKPEDYTYFITKHGMRSEDYNLVFPNDTRVIPLTPVDGVFNSTHEEFVASIKNITGGVEYRIIAEAKDLAGNEGATEIKTPYIREFENLGKILYDKGIIITANFYPLYPDPHPWEGLEPMAVHSLLGKYDVTDPVVIAKKIDMATGHGINCFDIAWHFDWVINNPHVLQKIKENIEAFLENPLSSQIYFFLGYDPSAIEGKRPDGIWELKNSTQWKKVLEDIKFLNSWGIFDHPRYLKIDGKSVMYFYEAQAMIGKVDEMLKDIDKIRDIFWIGDLVYTLSEPSSETIQQKKMLSYEGWSDWIGSWYIPLEGPINYNFVIALERAHGIWGGEAQKYGILYAPTVTPGFINLRDPTFPVLPRDGDMFQKEIEIALKYAIPSKDGKRIIFIQTLDEFGEATGIEPTREEGFLFCEILKSTLEKYLLNP
jgi:hypothetical protein